MLANNEPCSAQEVKVEFSNLCSKMEKRPVEEPPLREDAKSPVTACPTRKFKDNKDATAKDQQQVKEAKEIRASK